MKFELYTLEDESRQETIFEVHISKSVGEKQFSTLADALAWCKRIAKQNNFNQAIINYNF